VKYTVFKVYKHTVNWGDFSSSEEVVDTFEWYDDAVAFMYEQTGDEDAINFGFAEKGNDHWYVREELR
jgi:hypothetical protein